MMEVRMTGVLHQPHVYMIGAHVDCRNMPNHHTSIYIMCE